MRSLRIGSEVRVLVTRPEPGACRTAAKLRTFGFDPVILPLSRTRPLAVPEEAVPADAVAVGEPRADEPAEERPRRRLEFPDEF
mgnify:CR=1 FL=1